MHEIEALSIPVYPDDPTPWYAILRGPDGREAASSRDCETEAEARRELLAVLDARD